MSGEMTASEVLLRRREWVESEELAVLGYAISALQDAMFKVIANQARLESALKAHGVGAWGNEG